MLQLAVSAIFLFRHKYFPVFSLLYEMSYPVHNNSSRKELLKIYKNCNKMKKLQKKDDIISAHYVIESVVFWVKGGN